MEEKSFPSTSATVKEVSSTLYRLLLHPAEAKLDGEMQYEDDAWRFRCKGLHIQDFVPSYIDVYSYARKKKEVENGGEVVDVESVEVEYEAEAFVYSFSYLPDPTWLVNWENGTNVSEWLDSEASRVSDQVISLDLGMGEYLTGAVTEVVEQEDGETRLRLLSFTTNNNRDLTIRAAPKSEKRHRMQLPEGFGIIGRFPAPRYSFGFYVGWMTPKSWSISNHAWFPDSFRKVTRILLLTFHRIAKTHGIPEESTRSRRQCPLPSSAMQKIIQWLCFYESPLPSAQMKPGNWEFIKEIVP